jgi:hypothetical protein
VAGFEKINRNIATTKGDESGNVQADEDPIYRLVSYRLFTRNRDGISVRMVLCSAYYIEKQAIIGSSPLVVLCIFGSVGSRNGIVFNIDSEDMDW